MWRKRLRKTFICLANSRKFSGSCIAGKTVDGFQAFRPVSSSPKEELSEVEIRYEDGQLPKLLDIISLEVKNAVPNEYQPENWLIDTDYYWASERQCDFNNLGMFTDDVSLFWKNTESSYNGINDRIDARYFNTIKRSFVFLKLNSSFVIVKEEGREFGNPKRKVRLNFILNEVEYILPVTHPEIEREYLGQQDGKYPITEEHYISVSSGMPHSDNKIYLFAAGIIRNGNY